MQNETAEKRIEPVLDNHDPDRCQKCGRTAYPYFRNIPSRVIMNYMLLNHVQYLKQVIFDNIDYLNSFVDLEGRSIKKQERTSCARNAATE